MLCFVFQVSFHIHTHLKEPLRHEANLAPQVLGLHRADPALPSKQNRKARPRTRGTGGCTVGEKDECPLRNLGAVLSESRGMEEVGLLVKLALSFQNNKKTSSLGWKRGTPPWAPAPPELRVAAYPSSVSQALSCISCKH